MSARPGDAEFDFTLPRGFVDSAGAMHRHGRMRLARAEDEVQLLVDPRVQDNHAYLAVLLISRVLTRLGDLAPVGPAIVGQLYSSDFAFLQQLYMRLNAIEQVPSVTQCPRCGTEFGLDLDRTSAAPV